jgi:hypothetical protein
MVDLAGARSGSSEETHSRTVALVGAECASGGGERRDLEWPREMAC